MSSSTLRSSHIRRCGRPASAISGHRHPAPLRQVRRTQRNDMVTVARVINALQINHVEPRSDRRAVRHRSCSLRHRHGNSALEKRWLGMSLPERLNEMNPVALLTPTYGRDLELCTLLCESVDRHVTSFSKHYLLVPDCDLPLFAHFESERRIVLPASMFLPDWLRPLPRIIQRKRRQYWWSLRAKPVSGWHVQQLIKIAATISLPHQRYCILDSDIVFFRDFDLARFEYPESNSASEHAGRGHAEAAPPCALGRDQPSASWTARAVAAGVRLHRPHHLLGPADRARDGREDRGGHATSTGSRRCAGPASSPNTCCTAISCENDAALSGRHHTLLRAPNASAIGISRSSARAN